MNSIDRAFAARLLKMIGAEATLKVEQLAAGSATDYADYRERCGYIQALDNVRTWCREIVEDAQKVDDPPR